MSSAWTGPLPTSMIRPTPPSPSSYTFPWPGRTFPAFQIQKFAGNSSRGPYGDGVMETDYHIGQVLDALRDTGKENDTIVVFTSDNGPTLDQWPDAGYSPFRGGIGTVYEGGVRVPCIFRWPGVIEEGRVSNEIMCSMDLFSTFAHLGGGEHSLRQANRQHGPIKVPAGGQDNSSREWVVWYTGTDSSATTLPAAMRWHQFKIIRKGFDSFQGPESDYSQIPAVYNIEMDPGEEHNIAGEHDFVITAFQTVYRAACGQHERVSQYAIQGISDSGRCKVKKARGV